MYEVFEHREMRLRKIAETTNKAEAVKRMTRAARAAKVWGIRTRVWIERDGETIDSRQTTGTTFTRA